MFSLVTKMFVTFGHISKEDKTLTFKAMISKKLTCREDK